MTKDYKQMAEAALDVETVWLSDILPTMMNAGVSLGSLTAYMAKLSKTLKAFQEGEA